MSRAASYQFVQTDAAEVRKELIAKYEEITGRTLLPADSDLVFISWIADIIMHERVLLNFAANQNLPSRAVGENLDALGEFIYNLSRPDSKAARCTMLFEITEPQENAVDIPIGTRVTDLEQRLTWQTDENAAIPLGETMTLVSAVCLTKGTVGNGFIEGQICRLIDTDNIMGFSRCINTDISSGGSDAAEDEAYYELMRQSLEAYSTAGPRGAYEYHAKAVSSDVADVCAINPVDSPGVVQIYAITGSGLPADEGTKNAILAACNDDKVRPLTDYVEVCDPETVDFDIDITYYVDRRSAMPLSEISASVQAAVSEYIKWQTAKIGRDINPSQLSWLLRDTGIKRVEIKSPSFVSLRDGSGQLTPQFARLASKKITNGGYEDE